MSLEKVAESIKQSVPVYQNLKTEEVAAKAAFPVQTPDAFERNFDTSNALGLTYAHARKILALDGEQPHTHGYFRQARLWVSDGTAGRKRVWIQSEEEQVAEAFSLFEVLLPMLPKGRVRIACFVPSISELLTPFNNRYVETLAFTWGGPNESLKLLLRASNPTILIASPAVLRALATEVIQGRLILSTSRIFSTTEVLTEEEREWLSRQFGVVIQNIYWANEGFLGHSCSFGTLHLNEDLFLVEHDYLEADHKRFFPVITSLSRKTQPLLRYKLDDILIERRMACACGSRHLAIEQVEGRWSDVFYLRSEVVDDWVPVFPDTLRKVITSGSTAIQQYQIRQISPNEIELHLNVPQGMFGQVSWAVGEALKRLFGQLGVRLPLLYFHILEKAEEQELRFRNVRQMTPMADFEARTEISIDPLFAPDKPPAEAVQNPAMRVLRILRPATHNEELTGTGG
ncbi:MAG TPA: hypothetical protein PLO56_12790 [Rhodothermales bacterium]|nr:hypothetical protein [Rhodothermales bacterium]